MGCWREELWWNPWNSDSLVGATQSKWRTAGITRIRWALHPVTDATDQDWSRAFHLASTSEALCPGSWGDTCMVDVDFQCCSVFPIFSLSVSQFHKYGSYLGGETGRDETWLQLFFSSFRLRPSGDLCCSWPIRLRGSAAGAFRSGQFAGAGVMSCVCDRLNYGHLWIILSSEG